jgi:signal peptidase I
MRDVRDWSRIIVATLARGVIATLLGLALWAAAPAVIGWHPTTVMTGSMEPRLHPGDVVVSRPVAETSLHAGQVLLYDDPDMPGQLRLHRFDKTGTDGQIITKGDANPAADSTPIARSAVHGVAFIRVPYVGVPVMWLRDGEYLRVIGLVVILAVVALLSMLDASLRRPEDDDVAPGTTADAGERGTATDTGREARLESATRLQSVVVTDTRREARRRARRARRLGRAAAVVAAVLVVGGVGLVVPAKAFAAGFGSSAANPTSSWSAASTFDCLGRTVSNSPSFTYQFGAASGTSESDLSANGRTGTLSTGVTRVGGTCTSSPYVTLDGTAGQITTTSTTRIAGPTTFTVEAWIRTSTAAGKVIGFGNSQTGTSSSYDRQLYVNSAGRIVFGVYNFGNVTIASPAAVTDGAWHHVVGTMSSTGMALYVDGVSVGTNTNTAAETNSGWWRIGYDNLAAWPNAPTSSWFKGDLDDVSAYPAALTAAQVSTLYKQGR